MALLSQRAYARHRKELGLRGATHTAVQKAIADGRIAEAVVNGKIDPSLADYLWSEGSLSVDDEIEALRKAERLPKPGNGDGGNGSGGSARSEFSEARARREKARAKIAELDLQERLGELVRADEVARAAFNAARHARDVLIALPGRIAPAVHAAGTVEEITALLADEIENVCKELSSDKS